ncbi:MAG: hypothetical protein JWM10_5484 [Myxococcaceae bacterium]|nr:hypothetical protein [Myxococcaceae bacterium]
MTFDPPPTSPFPVHGAAVDPYREPTFDPWSTIRPAGFGVRFGARLIDVIARLVVSFGAGIAYAVIVAAAAVARGTSVDAALAPQGSPYALNTFLIGFMASVAYHAIAEGISGATLGKLLCGLRVTTPALGRASAVGVVIRNAAILVDGLFFGLVGHGAMKASEKQQRYGDRWGNTVVIYAAGAPAAVRGTTGALALGVVLSVVGEFVFSLVNMLVMQR